MNDGDLCGFCLRPSCAGDAISCPRRFDLMAAQTTAEVRAALVSGCLQVAELAAPVEVVQMAHVALAICVFCYGQGGLRVPCARCGVVGPVVG